MGAEGASGETKIQPETKEHRRMSTGNMTPEEITFIDAFNLNRPTLALFSKCSTKDELYIVRDAFFLGMASQLCHNKYESVRMALITDPTAFDAIAKSLNGPKGLETMVTEARASCGWKDLMDALHSAASAVGSDLDGASFESYLERCIA